MLRRRAPHAADIETGRTARARRQPRGKPSRRNRCGKIDARQNTIPQNADSRPGDPKRLPQRFQASWIRKRPKSGATTHRERPGSLGCRRIGLRLATTTNHRFRHDLCCLATSTGRGRCCRNSCGGRCPRRSGTTGCGCSSSLRAACGRCGTADGLLGYRRLLGGCCHQSLLSREIRLAINVCTDCTPCTTNRGQFLTARS